MAQLGRAFIEVRADLSAFPAELRTKLEAALREGAAGAEFTEFEDAAGKAGEKAGEKLAEGIGRKAKPGAERAGKDVATKFADSFLSLVSSVIFNKITLWTTLITAAGTAIGNLMPAIVSLAAAGPAALTGLIGAAATLKLAFHGVGEAIQGALSGDWTKQSAAALAKLTPAARSFVQEIAKLRPELQRLQRDVQQTFFVQLEGSLTRVTKNLLPALHTGLTDLAGGFGQVGRAILGSLSTPLARGALLDVFDGLHKVLIAMAPALGQLTTAFLGLASAASPFVTSLGVGLAGLIEKFSQFIATMQNSGALAGFFQTGLEVLRTLGTTLKNVWDLLSAIINGLSAGGPGFVGVLAQVTGALAQLFSSDQGQQFLAVLGQLVTLLGTSLVDAINGLGPALGVITPIMKFIVDHGNIFGPIAEGLFAFVTAVKLFNIAGPIFSALMKLLTAETVEFDVAADANPIGAIVLAVEILIAGIILLVTHWKQVKQWGLDAWHAILDAAKSLWGWISGVGDAIGGFFEGIGRWFEALPGRIGSFLASLPGVILGIFEDAVKGVAEFLGFAIGLIIGEFFLLPGQIVNALSALGSLLANVWNAAWAWSVSIVETGIHNTLDFFDKLPGRIWGFISGLPHMIGQAFHDAWDWAKREVREGADAVVDFARKLPGRLAGFFDNIGHTILGGLKSGINAVIDSFNHGIDDAASWTHISLPHIPRLAMGGLVTQPTLALIGEKAPEVVIPTDNPDRARQLLDEAGLTQLMAQGAGQPINVTVHATLGTGEILTVLDQRVELKTGQQAGQLTSGVRRM